MYFGSAFNIHSYITYYVFQKCFQYTYLYYTLCILEAPNMELFVLICTVGTSLWLHVHSSVTRSRLIVTLEYNKEPDFSSLLHSVHMEPEVCSDCNDIIIIILLNETQLWSLAVRVKIIYTFAEQDICMEQCLLVIGRAISQLLIHSRQNVHVDTRYEMT